MSFNAISAPHGLSPFKSPPAAKTAGFSFQKKITHRLQISGNQPVAIRTTISITANPVHDPGSYQPTMERYSLRANSALDTSGIAYSLPSKEETGNSAAAQTTAPMLSDCLAHCLHAFETARLARLLASTRSASNNMAIQLAQAYSNHE